MISKFYSLSLSFIILFLISCTADRKLNNPKEGLSGMQCEGIDYYVDEICESEKALLDWAAAYPKYRKLTDLTRPVLYEIMQETDIDHAAAIFYHRAITEPTNRKFIEYVFTKQNELLRKVPDYSKKKLIFAIAPGMFYKDNTEVDADGKLIRAIVKQMGIQEAVIPTDQTGTVDGNGQIICDFVQQNQDKSGIIIGSASKGSGDFKRAMELCGNEPYFAKVSGWFNFGGINKGSLVVNAMMDHWLYSREGKVYFWWKGYNYEGLTSMRAGADAPLGKDLVIPKGLIVVNIVGVPHSQLVTERGRPFYNYLAQFGPNEGLNLLADSYIVGTPLFPSWRNDHYFRVPMPEERIKAFITYIVEKKNIK
ncbi:hypothetical protein [Leptospira idonii]|uniref:Uncharacterized protein n=1 Tax=Leptospira idonii TaxID=1193500 RepID=A0A4R9LUP1_9LEPT|nr:hypothetical protein [Leptospira idonii]TGN17602.1 hypothetical protein EHS15_16350 [Leptospira idonii]